MQNSAVTVELLQQLQISDRIMIESDLEAESAVENYAAKLTVLELAATTHPSKQQILDLLKARDQVYQVLTNKKTQISQKILIEIVDLDERLKKQAGLITQIVQLSDWRASLHCQSEAWWWFLEPPTNQWDKYDWLWNALSITAITASISLVVDISSRLLIGIPDTFGAFTITTQSVLTLLAAGGALTKAGQEAIEKILISLKIPNHFQNEVKCSFALMLLLCLTGFRFLLPQIAVYYKQEGHKEHDAGRLANAQLNYIKAIKLNPDDWEVHYNLGQVYQQLQDLDRARAEYQIALQGDFERAYNNLARLYILDKKYAAAVELLQQAQIRAESNKNKDKYLQYFLLKNLSWARLEQKRYEEARVYLEEAIDLMNDNAAAYCLMAQVLERQNNKKAAIIEWEKCLAYATSQNPDEDVWIGLANQCLKEKQCLTSKGEN
ncbi:tetratricopeptide repeat protein [Nostoc sp. FACHB-87]|uniref:tetratricopeptide repeat protein n=1 Tax=Nostoc sp. FACHB-87 TaxID=2692841 RepID=UPI001683D2E0|nr:tetratricopeptide repeat protein [Nostoc sp. FACHB-87]